LEKYAVKIGGGTNHRIGLYDAILLQENSHCAAGGVRPALDQAHSYARYIPSGCVDRPTRSRSLTAPILCFLIQIECATNENLREALSGRGGSGAAGYMTPTEAHSVSS